MPLVVTFSGLGLAAVRSRRRTGFVSAPRKPGSNGGTKPADSSPARYPNSFQ
jgi:hypothetical protein